MKKAESGQTDTSKIREKTLEDMDEEELYRPENNVDYKKLPNGDKELKGLKSAGNEDRMPIIMKVTLVAPSVIKWTKFWTRSK